MIDTKKEELFETMPVPKAVARLAIPTVIGSIVMVLYNLADTYFVGLINLPAETAAVTYAAPVLLAFNAMTNLFGAGCSSLMSRALGKRDYDTVTRTSTFGFYGALVCAALMSILTTVFQPGLLRLLGVDETAEAATKAYLFWTVTCGAVPSILNIVMANMVKAEGSALHASIGTVSGCILNIILDPIFIMPWGLGMNASGAGCATFLSNSAACLYFFVLLYVKRGNTFVSLDIRKFTLRRDVAGEVCAVGIPASIQNLLNVTGMTVLNNAVSAFGTAAVAAMGITHKVNLVPVYFTMGLGQGIVPLVGYNYASGNTKRMKDTISFTLKIMTYFIVAATLLYWIFAGSIIGLFMENGEIVGYGTRFLRGFSLGLPFLTIDFFAVAIFQAVGMGKESLLFAILRKIVLEIPAIILLNKIWPLYGIAYSQLVAEVILCAAAVIVLMKLIKRLEQKKTE